MKQYWKIVVDWITRTINPAAAEAARVAAEAAQAAADKAAAEDAEAKAKRVAYEKWQEEQTIAQPHVEIALGEAKGAYEKLAVIGAWDIPGTKAKAKKLVEEKKAKAAELRKKAYDLKTQAQTTEYLADDVETGAAQLEAAIDLI